MISAVESLSPTRVKLTVEVPFDELKPSVDAAYRSVAGKIRVKGFRPGKVPPTIVDRQVGRGAVLEEAMQHAVPHFYGDAVRDNDVVVLGPPQVEVTEFVDGSQLVFTAEVDVRPEVTLPAYDSLAVTVEDADVSKEMVEDEIAELRDLSATLTTVERAAQDGDFVAIDVVASLDGAPIDGGEAMGLSYEVGSDSLLDGLDDVLRGMSAEEERAFTTKLASGEFAGREGDIVVTVRAVKAKERPELTDEFAQQVSGFDTVTELRENLRTRLERVKRVEQGIAARDHVLDALVSSVELPVPDSLVEEQATLRREEIVRQIEESDLTMEGYLAARGTTAEDFTREIVDDAQLAVKRQLLLDAVADKEQIDVTELELSEQLVRRAERLQVPPQQLAQSLVENNQLAVLVTEVRRGKALAMVLQAATITDVSGRPVDLEALRADVPVAVADGAPAQTTADEPAGESDGEPVSESVDELATADAPAADSAAEPSVELPAPSAKSR